MYIIRRRYFNAHYPSRIIATDLTLEEAQEHCSDPDTSSRTCTSEEGKAHTLKYGPWMDTYDEA
jgi:hypothetical protein